MKVFISYSVIDADLAKSVTIGLQEQGHTVFFDRRELQPGDSHHPKIRKAIRDAYLLIFLARAESVSKGAYAMTEMGWFEEKCPVPTGRLLTVKTDTIDVELIPAYLRSVAVLERAGDLSAEILDNANRILGKRKKKLVKKQIGIIAGILAIGIATIIYLKIPNKILNLIQNSLLKPFNNLKLDPRIKERSGKESEIPERSETKEVDFKKTAEDKLYEEVKRKFVSKSPQLIYPTSITREGFGVMWGIWHNVIYRMEDIDLDGVADKFNAFYIRKAGSRDDKSHAFPPWTQLEVQPSSGRSATLKVFEYSTWIMIDSDGDYKVDKIEKANDEE